MASPPETDRQYAYFRATGLGNTEFIDDLMKLDSSEYWNVGDQTDRLVRNFKRKYSCWKLDSGLDDTHELEKHIESLLLKLWPKLEILNQIRPEYHLQIVCVSHVYQSFSFELPFEQQKQATNLGISFWFDSYSFGDLHEEVTELRVQLRDRE